MYCKVIWEPRGFSCAKQRQQHVYQEGGDAETDQELKSLLDQKQLYCNTDLDIKRPYKSDFSLRRHEESHGA
ncbi:hypothetical protein STEG23_013054, partial [Scotinomys teguina]